MFPFLFGSLQRSLITAVVATVLLGGLGLKIYLNGRDAGREAQGREMTVDRERERTADRAVFEATLLTEQVKAAEAERRYLEARALVVQLNTKLDQLRLEITSARQTVTRLSDDQLFADVRAKLAMVPPTDTSPFTAPELREIDIRVTEHPLLGRQAEVLQQTIAAQQKQLAAQLDALRSIVAQRDAGITAYNQLTGHYVVAYNALRKRNWFVTVITLGLAGGPNKLPIPDPVQLRTVETDAVTPR